MDVQVLRGILMTSQRTTQVLEKGNGINIMCDRNGQAYEFHNSFRETSRYQRIRPSENAFDAVKYARPHAIDGVTDIIRASCGNKNVLCLEYSGAVWQWNSAKREKPQIIRELSVVVSISCGYEYEFFITNDGQAWCKGDNLKGQLGLGDTQRRDSLQLVPGVSNANQVFCGIDTTFVLCEKGGVLCCGNNSMFQMSRKFPNTPQLQFRNLFEESGITRIAVGSKVCIFLCRDGSVLCSGETDIHANPSAHEEHQMNLRFVPELSNITQIACRDMISYCIDEDGILWYFKSRWENQKEPRKLNSEISFSAISLDYFGNIILCDREGELYHTYPIHCETAPDYYIVKAPEIFQGEHFLGICVERTCAAKSARK